jgi:hypothetical protein
MLAWTAIGYMYKWREDKRACCFLVRDAGGVARICLLCLLSLFSATRRPAADGTSEIIRCRCHWCDMKQLTTFDVTFNQNSTSECLFWPWHAHRCQKAWIQQLLSLYWTFPRELTRIATLTRRKHRAAPSPHICLNFQFFKVWRCHFVSKRWSVGEPSLHVIHLLHMLTKYAALPLQRYLPALLACRTKFKNIQQSVFASGHPSD